MRIVYHLGAHCTDEDRLVRCLLKNRTILAEQGIVVPSPTRYRKLMRDAVVQLRGMPASQDTQALILEQIMEAPEAHRLILSWDSFLAFPAWATAGGFYAGCGRRVSAFTRVFPDIAVEFHLAIRNPVTYLPALQEKVSTRGKDVLDGVDPRALRWSAVIEQLMAHNPDVPLTVWCDEETPLIWPEVLAAVSGHAPGTALVDTEDVLEMIMNEIGLARMRAYCTEHPPQTVSQRRRIVTAFLEKFARPEAVEVEIKVPGWTTELVEDLTARYNEDVNRIRRMPGIRFIEA
jgi:hypothetical protein